MISNLHLITGLATYNQQRFNDIRLLEGTNMGGRIAIRRGILLLVSGSI